MTASVYLSRDAVDADGLIADLGTALLGSSLGCSREGNTEYCFDICDCTPPELLGASPWLELEWVRDSGVDEEGPFKNSFPFREGDSSGVGMEAGDKVPGLLLETGATFGFPEPCDSMVGDSTPTAKLSVKFARIGIGALSGDSRGLAAVNAGEYSVSTSDICEP